MASRADQLLAAAGAEVGDRVRYDEDERAYEGIVMPRHAFAQPDVLILKLSSGYNVGLRCGPKARLALVTKSQARPHAPKTIPKGASKPRIAVLGTGGTIASFVDYRTGAVHPAATAEELAFATPELFEIANVEAKVVYQVFSEDLEPRNWSELAREVKAAFDGGVTGVIIPHGTDTLHYTAAALSFCLSDLPGPVVLVAAQRSSDRPSSDAAGNLVAAARVAAMADLGEVVLLMHEGSSDEQFAILPGTRARKNHTSRRDAFRSINAPPLGRVVGERIELADRHRRRSSGPAVCRDAFETKCRLVWSYPLLQPEAFKADGVRGIVIAGSGLGHVPRRCLDAIGAATRAGVLVAMASQCLWGRVNMKVYSTGRDLIQRGVLDAQDTTPEVALVKLMWLLANERDPAKVQARFAENLAGELAPTTPFEGQEA